MGSSSVLTVLLLGSSCQLNSYVIKSYVMEDKNSCIRQICLIDLNMCFYLGSDHVCIITVCLLPGSFDFPPCLCLAFSSHTLPFSIIKVILHFVSNHVSTIQ